MVENLDMRIYVRDLQVDDEKAGEKRFDLDEYDSSDDLRAAIEDWLKESGHPDGKWDVVACNDIPDELDWSDLDALYKWKGILEDRSDKLALESALHLKEGDIDEAMKYYDECYEGWFSSDEEFAENLAVSIGVLDNRCPWWLEIDWEATAGNVMQEYSQHEGHYFKDM